MSTPIIMSSDRVLLRIQFENHCSCVVTGLHDLEHPDVALADEW